MKNFILSILVLLISFSGFSQNKTDSDNNAKSVQNVPLFEEFTSSTCPPCATFNSGVFTPFMNAHPDDITVIKYQMSWPAPGDPYFTAEGGNRRVYYGVNSVPDLFAGGEDCPTTSTGVNNAYTTQMSKPSYFTITSTAEIIGTNITVDTDIMPEIDGNFTVQMVVIEKLTTGNVGNNGETEFKNVMMKMLPDENGTAVSFVTGVNSNVYESFDMVSTNVEEMSDLAVVVFIQNDNTKEVLQSAYSYVILPPPTVLFDPANGETNVDALSEVILTFDQPMRLIDDNPITNANVSDFVHLSDPNKGNLTFTASVNENQSLITVTPDVMFNELTDITITIDGSEIENAQDLLFAGESAMFTTHAYPIPLVSFDPVNGATDVNYDTEIILTFDLGMRNLDNSEIANADISNFVTLTDPSKANIAFSGTINAEKTMITIMPDIYLPELEDITVTVIGDMIENVYNITLAESFSTFTTGSYPAANVVFNPLDGENNVGVTRNVTLTFDHSMRMLDDSEITNDDISSFISLTDPTKGDIAYTGTITGSKDLIVLNPDENLPGLTDITVAVADNVIENGFDKALAGISVTFTTEDVNNISEIVSNITVFPNPANNYFNISGAKNSKIQVLDISGRIVINKIILTDIDQIGIENLDSGIYILRIITNTTIIKKKISIIK